MKRFADFLRWCAFALACLVLAGAGLALFAERSGWLARRVRDALAERIGEPVSLEEARLDWLAPALEIRGLALGPGDELRLERLRLAIDRGAGLELRVRRIDVDGGRVRLAPHLVQRLERAGRRWAETSRPRAGAGELPSILVQDVQLDLELAPERAIRLGWLEAWCEADEAGAPRVEGRVRLDLAAAGAEAAEIQLGTRVLEDGRLELHASSEALPIASGDLPATAALDPLRAWKPSGNLALEARGRLALDGSASLEGELRASLAGGSLLFPGARAPLEAVQIELDARLEASTAGLVDPRSWEATASVHGRWNGSPIEAWVLYGRAAGPGLAARGSLRALALPLAGEELLAIGPLRRALEQPWAALEPRGRADVACAVSLPLEPGEDGRRRPSVAVLAEAGGSAGVTFHGWVDSSRGGRSGFPLPVEQVSGTVVVLHDPGRKYANQVGLFDLRGAHGDGTPEERPAAASGILIWPEGPGARAQWDLGFRGRAVRVDAGLREALQALHGAEWVWPAFSPRGGEAEVEGRTVRRSDMAHPAARFGVRLRDATLSWSELPAPLSGAHGEVEVVLDARQAFGAGFAVEGASATAESIHVAGRIQEDPAAKALAAEHGLHDGARDGSPDRSDAGQRAGAPAHPPRIEVHEVRAQNLALRGVDRDALVARFAVVGSSLDQVAPTGKVDLACSAVRAHPGAPLAWQVELAPRQVQVSPRAFRVVTRNVRGRVLITGEDEGEALTRIVPLAGDWPGETRVACLASFPSGGEARLQLFGAGIDLSNRGVTGAFRAAFSAADGGYGGLDLTALTVDGRVDLAGDIALAGAGEGRYRVYLRDNDFQSAEASHLELKGLRGILLQTGGQLYGDDLEAVLGRTPIRMREARFSVRDGVYLLETRLEARGLPIDREHVRAFLDSETVEALIGELEWRGSIDIADATLAISGRPEGGRSRVEFRGRVVPSEMFVDIGLPLSIETAQVQIEDLVLEGGHVRAWASVSGLDGEIAGRRLERARMVFTYVEPHLSILDLDGRLEDGRLRDLDGGRVGAGPAFSIDFQEPFPFQLALRMDDVQIAGLLRGLFESDFASRGLLSGEIRLAGSLDRMTGIRGEGSVSLREAALWSIPVMRDLLAQLGLDSGALFERVRTHFRIEDGAIEMEGIHVHSPLVQLVGSGTLDFDGRLEHDLQVRYSIVDRLGPLTRLLYWVQNNLLSIAVRGDMSRPRVVLRGALALFSRLSGASRDLPLPGFAPLPERF
jgi:hypothetical protein